MYKRKSSLLKHIDFFILDLICLAFSFFIAYAIRSSQSDFINNSSYWYVFLWMAVPNLLYYILFNPYQDVLRRSNVEEAKLSIYNTAINFFFIVSILFILRIGVQYSRLILLFTYVIYLFLSCLTRIIWKLLILKNIVKINAEPASRMLVIGKSDEIKQILYNIKNSDFAKHDIVAIYLNDDVDVSSVGDYPVIREKKDILNYVVDNNINIVFVTAYLNKGDSSIIRRLIDEGIEVQMYIDAIFGIEAEDKEISTIGMYNTLQLNSYNFTSFQRIYFIVKRVADVAVSLIGCILLIPTYLVIKTSYLLSGDRAPIIYTHTRIGLDGRPFELYKFRSMVPDADDILKEMLKDEKIKKEWDENQKLDDDPRITGIGKLIRKTSIDEMPQFINVLKGDMSIIGPRPLVPGELKSKNGIKLYERVKPGITGWWACNGRSEMSYEERLEHEYYYVRNCSLYLDILCVFRTIYVVLFRKGAR